MLGFASWILDLAAIAGVVVGLHLALTAGHSRGAACAEDAAGDRASGGCADRHDA